jgi:phage FluMu protein Com
MQIRCTYCQTMFAISQEEMLAALEHMEESKQIYYDAHCPKCRRANRVERTRMERFFPDWKKALKTMEKEATKAEKASEKEAIEVSSSKPVPIRKPVSKAAKKPDAKPVKKSSGTKKG